MDVFAFILHPLDPKVDVARKYPTLARVLPASLIHFFSRYWPPVVLSQIRGVRSAATGREIKGWLLACPFTAERMIRLPPPVAYRKIIQTGRLAERLGARILGLGAYTSVVGDGGITVARALDIPVTTGDSYTVALAIAALMEGGRQMGIEVERATAAVVGATGAIGSACARLLASRVERQVLVGRRMERLQEVAAEVYTLGGSEVEGTLDVAAIRQADLVISATSAGVSVIHSGHLKPGAVICDVARPRDVAAQVKRERDDVLVIDGGLAETPGEVDFGFDYGLPPRLTFGCMAETMALALEGRFEDYTVGKNLEIGRIQEIEQIADRHGFRLAGLRSFEHSLTQDQIQSVRRRADRAAQPNREVVV